MKYSAAIQIDPHWDDADLARAKEALVFKIAREINQSKEQVVANTTFEQRLDFGNKEVLIAVYKTRVTMPVMWPV